MKRTLVALTAAALLAPAATAAAAPPPVPCTATKAAGKIPPTCRPVHGSAKAPAKPVKPAKPSRPSAQASVV